MKDDDAGLLMMDDKDRIDSIVNGALSGQITIDAPVPREENKRLSQINFEPLGNWCLVKQIDAAVKVGSLIVPEAYGQTFRKGIVFAVGKGTVYSSGVFIETPIAVGEVVLFGKAAGLEVTLAEGAFLLIRESECFGKLPSKQS